MTTAALLGGKNFDGQRRRARRARSNETTSPITFSSVVCLDMQKILRDRCLSTPHNEVAEQ